MEDLALEWFMAGWVATGELKEYEVGAAWLEAEESRGWLALDPRSSTAPPCPCPRPAR